MLGIYCVIKLAWNVDPEYQVSQINTYKNLRHEIAKGRDDM